MWFKNKIWSHYLCLELKSRCLSDSLIRGEFANLSRLDINFDKVNFDNDEHCVPSSECNDNDVTKYEIEKTCFKLDRRGGSR